MAIAAGERDKRLVFLRRAPVSRDLADPLLRGGFADIGQAWGAFQDMGEDEIQISFLRLRARKATVTIPSNGFTRNLTTADRVAVLGTEFEITGVGPAPRSAGNLRLNVLESPSRSLYARAMDQEGEVVTVRRTVTNGAPIDVRVRAMVSGYEPNELISGITQATRKIVLSAQDLEEQDFPLPPKAGDYIFAEQPGITRRFRIDHVDAATHRIAGIVNAYNIQATGQ